jgi:hypothetical protein
MRKTLLSVLAVGFFAVFSFNASAAMLKKELGDGSADWLNTITDQVYPIAVQDIQVRITDVSTASTEEIYILRDGTVKALHCALGGAISSANAVVSLAYNAGNSHTGGVNAPKIAQLLITQSGSAAGDIDSSTGLSTVVTAGSLLALGTDGGSSTAAASQCWIVVETQ